VFWVGLLAQRHLSVDGIENLSGILRRSKKEPNVSRLIAATLA
jgi:hypothetical protein